MNTVILFRTVRAAPRTTLIPIGFYISILSVLISIRLDQCEKYDLKVFTRKCPGFPPTLENLENLEKWDNFFQSGKSQGILKKY